MSDRRRPDHGAVDGCRCGEDRRSGNCRGHSVRAPSAAMKCNSFACRTARPSVAFSSLRAPRGATPTMAPLLVMPLATCTLRLPAEIPSASATRRSRGSCRWAAVVRSPHWAGSDGNLYVAIGPAQLVGSTGGFFTEHDPGRIVKFTASGTLLAQWGVEQSGQPVSPWPPTGTSTPPTSMGPSTVVGSMSWGNSGAPCGCADPLLNPGRQVSSGSGRGRRSRLRWLLGRHRSRGRGSRFRLGRHLLGGILGGSGLGGTCGGSCALPC